MDVKKMRATLKKAWHFIWYDDSLLSWVVNIILAFVIIKFLVYPGLGFALQTDNPVVAVVSESMDHAPQPMCERSGTLHIGGGAIQDCVQYSDDRYEMCGEQTSLRGTLPLEQYWDLCGSWYEQRNITQSAFDEFAFSSGFSKGDIMILYGTEPEDIVVGDVIVFRSNSGRPIIHRVIDTRAENDQVIFATKGDSNPDQITTSELNETDIADSAYVGRAVGRIPWIGYVKVLFTDLLRAVMSVF